MFVTNTLYKLVIVVTTILFFTHDVTISLTHLCYVASLLPDDMNVPLPISPVHICSTKRRHSYNHFKVSTVSSQHYYVVASIASEHRCAHELMKRPSLCPWSEAYTVHGNACTFFHHSPTLHIITCGRPYCCILRHVLYGIYNYIFIACKCTLIVSCMCLLVYHVIHDLS